MPAQLAFLSHYASDPSHRGALLDLVRDVLAVDLRAVEQAGWWDPAHAPFSCFDGPVCAANVSVVPLSLLVAGRAVRGAGIQCVATRPEHRGRGLFHRLMNAALAWCDETAQFESAFLYTGTPSLYVPFGFRPLSEDRFVCLTPPPPMGRAPGRGCFRDADRRDPGVLARLDSLLARRCPVSFQLGLSDQRAMFLWNLLSNPEAALRFSADMDFAALGKVAGETLILLDVIAPQLPPLQDVLAAFDRPVRNVEFRFTPDRFVPLDSCDVRPLPSQDTLMVRGPLEIEHQPFAFPPTGHF